jgi:dTDP-4-dehydrorhamnose reductase
MTIALIGADGQLGTELLRILPRDGVAPLYYPAFDVTRPDLVRAALAGIGPRVVINTAAFHRVDECESRPHLSFRVNALAVRDLAALCREMGAVLVHFSTDYVFDGRKTTPYVESDAPNPLNIYAASKLAGERFLQASGAKFFLVRTCGLFGPAGCREKGRNFVETMLALAERGGPIRVVNDQTVGPTSAAELAVRVAALIATDRYGLYHLTSDGSCTWYEFARQIFRALGREAQLVPVTSEEFGAPARRPRFSVLANGKARALGLPAFSPWAEALEAYLRVTGLKK